MFHLLYYFFGCLINIDVFIILLIVLGFFMARGLLSRIGKALLGAGVLLFILTAVTPTARWMLAYLENYYPRYEGVLPADTKGIIILGAGGLFDPSITTTRGEAVFNIALGRLMEGIALARAHPGLKVLYTGSAENKGGRFSEVDLAKRYFSLLGIEQERLTMETASRHTQDNAQKTFYLMRPQPQEKWVLITSALHMPRAVSLFKAYGWNIIPYPVDYYTNGYFPLLTVPNLRYTYLMWATAVKEWAGLLTNWLRHTTPSVLPEKNE